MLTTPTMTIRQKAVTYLTVSAMLLMAAAKKLADHERKALK